MRVGLLPAHGASHLAFIALRISGKSRMLRAQIHVYLKYSDSLMLIATKHEHFSAFAFFAANHRPLRVKRESLVYGWLFNRTSNVWVKTCSNIAWEIVFVVITAFFFSRSTIALMPPIVTWIVRVFFGFRASGNTYLFEITQFAQELSYTQGNHSRNGKSCIVIDMILR